MRKYDSGIFVTGLWRTDKSKYMMAKVCILWRFAKSAGGVQNGLKKTLVEFQLLMFFT